MTWFDKLQFWKRKEQEIPSPVGAPPLEGPGPMPGMEPSPGLGAPAQLPGMGAPLGMPEPAGLPPQPTPVLGVTPKPEVIGADKELQLVNAKLDAIKAVVDNINQRLDRM